MPRTPGPDPDPDPGQGQGLGVAPVAFTGRQGPPGLHRQAAIDASARNSRPSVGVQVTDQCPGFAPRLWSSPTAGSRGNLSRRATRR